MRTILPDKLTAIQTAQAMTAALFARTRTGEGQHVQLSMLDTVLAFLWSSDMAGYTFVGDETGARDGRGRADLRRAHLPDGGRLDGGLGPYRQHLEGPAAAVGRPEWLEDPRFATVAAREINKPARLELTQEALREDTTENWMRRLTDHDVPCAPVLTRAEVWSHPQVAGKRGVTEQDHPQAGRIRQARMPARFSATPPGEPAPAHRLGQDTRAVLGEAGL